MPDHVVGEKSLAVFVPVEAPRIGSAMGHHFETVACRMVTPDGAIQRDTLVFRRAGPANARGFEDAVSTVKPAIRAPCEAVDHVVGCLKGPAVEVRFAFAVRDIVAVAVRNEKD